MPKSVIYCRVSSDRQAREGHGIDGQERHCRQYAEGKGYEVVRVFKDEGVSGGVLDRPGMDDLLDFLAANKKERHVVIVDDLKRLARDVVTHFQLKKLFQSRNAALESPTQSLEDTPEGKFMETIFAATAELERNQNKRQVLRRMKARLEAGYWTFYPPPGYAFATEPRHGKILVPKEPQAGVIREAIEGYASGRFATQSDVQRFLRARGFRPRTDRGKGVTYLQEVRRLLTQEVYAGIIHYPPWNVAARKGHHRPLVNPETFDRVQERLREQEKAPYRKDLNPDFPLRGFTLCGECRKPLTAFWSRGRRGGAYAYYRCNTHRCPDYNKSTRADRMHSQFEALLARLRPREGILQVVRAELLAQWDAKKLSVDAVRKERRQRLAAIQTRIDAYLDVLPRCHNPTVIERIETEVGALEAKKLRLGGRIKKPKNGDYEFAPALDRVLSFIENPLAMWNSGDLRQRRLVLRLIFEEPLVFDRERGFETPQFSLPIAVACVPELDEIEMVDMIRGHLNRLADKVRVMAEMIKDASSMPEGTSAV